MKVTATTPPATYVTLSLDLSPAEVVEFYRLVGKSPSTNFSVELYDVLREALKGAGVVL